MTLPSYQSVIIPAITDAGTISIAASARVATGNAATLAAITSGKRFILPGIQRVLIAADNPIDLGGGVCTFELFSAWSSTPYSGKAWALASAPGDDELALIVQQDDAGATAGRAAHNSEADGYCYLDTTTAIMWERNGPSGNWTNKGTTAVLWVSSTTGSDTDDDNPVRATVQAAIDVLAGSSDLTGWNVIIALKPGTYAPFVLKEIAGAPAMLKICGEASLTGTHSPSTYIVSSTSPLAAVQATNLKDAWTLEGFKLTSTKGHLLQAKGARLRFNQLDFGAAAGAHVAALAAGSIVMAGNGYTISGGASAHLLANGSGGTVDLQAEASVATPTITISATTYVFKTAFAWARASGHIFTGTGLIFSTRTAVGRRWRAEQNSSIDTGQSGERYLPGTLGTSGNGIAVKNGEYI